MFVIKSLQFHETANLLHWTRFFKWQLCPYDVELGNQGNETLALKETIDVSSECHFTKNMLRIG